MFIMGQNRDKLIDCSGRMVFAQANYIHISDNVRVYSGDDLCIAGYKSEKRAKEVLLDIVTSLSVRSTKVFMLPED